MTTETKRTWTDEQLTQIYESALDAGYTRADARLLSCAPDMLALLRVLMERAAYRLDVTDPETGETFYETVKNLVSDVAGE